MLDRLHSSVSPSKSSLIHPHNAVPCTVKRGGKERKNLYLLPWNNLQVVLLSDKKQGGEKSTSMYVDKNR